MLENYKKTDLWDSKPQVDKFDKRCAYILVRAIQKMRKTTRRTKIWKWIPQFEKLRTLDGIEKQRIKNALYWYISHLKDKYVPKVYSADGFRNKFFQIEAAMEQARDEEREKREDFEIDTYREGNIIIDVIHYDD